MSTIVNTPPIIIERDSNGLRTHVQHCFTPEGFIDWKKMVPLEYLYINPLNRDRLEKKYEKKLEDIDIVEDGVEDRDLVVLLAGIKYLLFLRGYRKLEFIPVVANENYASVVCKITFTPNYESENAPIEYSDCACAHLSNTKSFGRNYLIEMASNRAFCRTIRNFLKINIVSNEELGETAVAEEESNTETKPHEILERLMSKHNITFEKIQKKLVKDGVPRSENFVTIKDIPKMQILGLITKIKEKKSDSE